jgi:hypothetical protein
LKTSNNELKNVTNARQLNKLVENFTIHLTNICNQSIPLASKKIFTKSNKWWTQELTQLRLEVNRARRRFQRCQTARKPELKAKYYAIKTEKYEKLMAKTRLDKWQQFVTENTRQPVRHII